MANITNYLNKIKTAVYGKDVRGAIHDAIKQVYDDASVNHDNANMEVKMARGTHNTLNDRLDNVDEIQAQTNAQLSDIGSQLANISVQIKSNGIDDTQQINDLINSSNTLSGNNLMLTEGEFILTDTIRLKKGVKLFGASREKTKLIFINDVDCVNITGNSQLSNLTIEVPKGYTKNCINCQSWKMDSVDNASVDKINIRQAEKSDLPAGNALNLEVSSTRGGNIYFTNFIFRDIDVKGSWENGINNTIHYSSDNDPTWLTVMNFENIFFNTVKNTINFNYTNNNNVNLTFPRANSFADYHFKNVSTQYKDGETERFLILSNVVRSRFDMCIPWDWNRNATIDGKKPYQIKCDDDVRVIINDIMYTSRPYDVIDFLNGDSDNLVNMKKHLVSYTTIDSKNYNVFEHIENTFTRKNSFNAEVHCNDSLTANQYVVMKEDNPDNVPCSVISYKPIYFYSHATGSGGLNTIFFGLHFSSNNKFGGTADLYSYELGLDGDNKMVYRTKGTNWSKFHKIISDNYFPHGLTSSRPTSPTTGFMYFDTTIGKPVWWNGVAWVDSNGISV